MIGAESGRPFVLLATTNRAKQRELIALLGDLPVRWITLRDLPPAPEVEETGSTFVENARIKATAYARWSGIPALADDGGLAIDALGGEPGVHSRRWIDGREATDERLIAYAIERMRGVPLEKRAAAMVVAEVLSLPPEESAPLAAIEAMGHTGVPAWLGQGESETVGEGEMRGIIAETPSSTRDPGFPYRSILYFPHLGKFSVDLTVEEHGQVSHRRIALEPIRARLLRHC